jgi:hypothetical protein
MILIHIEVIGFYKNRSQNPSWVLGPGRFLEQSPKNLSHLLNFYRNFACGNTSCVAEPVLGRVLSHLKNGV